MIRSTFRLRRGRAGCAGPDQRRRIEFAAAYQSECAAGGRYGALRIVPAVPAPRTAKIHRGGRGCRQSAVGQRREGRLFLPRARACRAGCAGPEESEDSTRRAAEGHGEKRRVRVQQVFPKPEARTPNPLNALNGWRFRSCLHASAGKSARGRGPRATDPRRRRR